MLLSSSYQLEEEADARNINDTVPKPPRKRQLWANRYRRLGDKFFTALADPSCREADPVFLGARVPPPADNYLIKLWGHVSRATVQRTLQKLEESGLLRRLTTQKTSRWLWVSESWCYCYQKAFPI